MNERQRLLVAPLVHVEGGEDEGEGDVGLEVRSLFFHSCERVHDDLLL